MEEGSAMTSTESQRNMTFPTSAAGNGTALKPGSLERVSVVTAIVTSSCAFLGAWVIVYSFLVFIELRTTGRKILVHLSLVHCFMTVGNIVGGVALLYEISMNSMCSVAALFVVFSSVSCSLWTVAFNLYLYICLVWKHITFANRLVWLFHAVCWGIPVFVVATTAAFHASSCSGFSSLTAYPSWWWLNGIERNKIPWIFLTDQGWAMGSYVIILMLSASIWRNRRNQKRRKYPDTLDDDDVTTQVSNRQLRAIPLLFIACRLWGTARFLLAAYVNGFLFSSASEWLLVLQAFGDNAQGLLNGVAFCWCTKRVRSKLKKKLCCVTMRSMRRGQLRTRSHRLPVLVTELHSKYDCTPTPFDETMGSTSLTIQNSEKTPILEN